MLISDFTIMCDDCGRKYRIPSDSLNVDYACSERPMGTEVQHIFYGEMDCQCGNRLLYTVTAEYSCAVTPQVRQTGNRLSGLAGTAYASLLT